MLFGTGGAFTSLSGGKLSGRPAAASVEIMVAALLSDIRAAITAYGAANGGAFPGADGSQVTLKADLQPYIDPFPATPVGNMNANVNMQNTGNPSLPPSVGNSQGWAYAFNNGMIIVNSNATDGEGTPWSSY